MKTQITIVHTNDLHSHFDRWPHTATVVRQELARAAAEGRPAVYLDAGDHVDMSERISYGTRARVNRRLLADLGCRAYTLGNNETMRLHLHEITQLAQESPFPWLGANLVGPNGAPPAGVKEWAMLDACGVKIGVTGMTPLGPATAALGFPPVGELEILRRVVREMREAGAHLVLFLSHLGFRDDMDMAGNGVDLIVGGHSHTALAEPQWYSKSAIVQAGEFGKYVGVLDVEVDLERRSFSLLRGRLAPVDPDSVPADPEALRIIAEESAAAEAALSEVITVLPEDLPHDPVGASKLGPLLAEALRQNAGAEVGLVMGGQAHSGFTAGPLTRNQVMAAMPPMFIPALLEFKGSHLQALLEQSEDPACHGHLLWDSGMRPRGKAVGRIFTAGLDRAADGSLLVNGQPLDPERTYTVGAPSLLGFIESGYSALAGVRIVRRYMPQFVRELFEEKLRAGALPPAP